MTLSPRLSASVRDGAESSIVALSEQLPDPGTLAAGSWIAVRPGSTRSLRSWLRLRAGDERDLHLAVRCTALLVRGYMEVCAREDVAFARAP
jgi:hypothetical protein